MIFEPELETLPNDRLRELQAERLAATVRYVSKRVPFYGETLSAAGVKHADMVPIEDLPTIPFTRKKDLVEHYPYGLLAVPKEEVVRVHASSGTTGKPTVVAYTAADMDLFARVVARCLALGGGQPGFTLHNAYGYGLFTGGLGLDAGGMRLGMAVVPASGGMTQRQVTLISDLRPEIISATPSYALTLAQELRSRGISPEENSLRYAVVGAEPWTEPMRVEIDATLGVRCTNIYGLSEIIGPGVANECIEERHGSHIQEDFFLPEVVDPQSGDPLEDGEEGVLVLTTLTKQALPLLRYWTGDITSLSHEPCSCGRTFARMSQIKGRTDDMIIIRGVNLYPTQIGDVLGLVRELSPHFKLVVSREGLLDEVEVRVEVTEEFFRAVSVDMLSDEVVEADHVLRSCRERTKTLLKDSLGVNAKVTLLAPGEGPRSEGGKLSRIEDHRNLN
ncbi:MAG: phenylacetate--CoA ligase [Actinobacteria bacterium]|nr:phenylacetate--CoA ligase [Actinomycetota bacterium]